MNIDYPWVRAAIDVLRGRRVLDDPGDHDVAQSFVSKCLPGHCSAGLKDQALTPVVLLPDFFRVPIYADERCMR